MSSLREPVLRIVLVVSCLACAAASWVAYADWHRQRDELLDLLRQAGFDNDDPVIDQARYERTSHHARVAAARALLYQVLDAEPAAGSSGAVAPADGEKRLVVGSDAWEAAVDRLPDAAGLARRVLEDQPNSWQGAMLLGASIYLERSIRRDPRLYTAYGDWEIPLTRAMREAPGQDEPRRFLAAAYLEVWPALAPPKKERTRELLREAFERDAGSLPTLLPTWIDTAESLDEAFALIPSGSEIWGELERIFARRHQWSAFCQAHIRHRDALLEENEARLQEAEERLRLGDLFYSRSLLLQVAASSPLEPRFVPLVSRALELYPPGLHGLSSTAGLRRWLRWALELHPYGIEVLSPAAITRLASAAGQIERSERALAALVGGEIYHAESFERSADTTSIPEWGPYLLSKARWHLERGEVDPAAAVLKLVAPVTRRSLHFALIRLEVERARGDLVAQAEAERGIDSFRARRWSAGAWQKREYGFVLPILSQEPADGLVVGTNNVPETGAVIEIRWDARPVDLRPVIADGDLRLDLAVDTGLHLLEIRMLAGGQLSPGSVTLPEP